MPVLAIQKYGRHRRHSDKTNKSHVVVNHMALHMNELSTIRTNTYINMYNIKWKAAQLGVA